MIGMTFVGSQTLVRTYEDYAIWRELWDAMLVFIVLGKNKKRFDMHLKLIFKDLKAS